MFCYTGDAIFSFDGAANTVVDLRTTLQCVQGNNPRSFSFMIQTIYTSYARILSTGNARSYSAFNIEFYQGIIRVDVYDAAYFPPTGKAINDGLWHTVLVTYDGSTLSIYVDGILDNTATNWNVNNVGSGSIASALNTAGNSGNYLGVYTDGISYAWIGQLKNVYFYDCVITNSPTYLLSSLTPTIVPTTAINNLLYTSGNYIIF